MAPTQVDWRFQDGNDEHRVHRRGPDLRITLARPRKGNTLTIGLVQSLTAIYQTATHDPTILRVLLTAEGKFFCAGMDLNARGGVLDTDQEAKQEQWDLLQSLFHSIERCNKVTLALVNGPAFGAGIGLVFACDIRIAVEQATFNISEAKVGLTPAVVMELVLREWGTSRGREAMLTARPVGSKELLGSGIVHAVVSSAYELERAAEKQVRHLDACGPAALAKIKEACLAPEVERKRMIKATYIEMMRPTPEARHGVESFHAKKSPDWASFYARRKTKM